MHAILIYNCAISLHDFLTIINFNNEPFEIQTWQTMTVNKCWNQHQLPLTNNSHIWMGLYNEWPLIIIILTRSNTLGKTCLEESLELHIKDMRYENNIPAGMYRRVAIITQPIAGGGDSEGGCKAGISVNNSITGIDATMPSEIRRSSQYTKDDTPDTLSKWRIFICDRSNIEFLPHCKCCD